MSGAWLHEAVQWMQTIQGVGWIGWILFIGTYALACLLFLPGAVLTLGAGAIYGFWGGVALVLLGNGLGSLLSLLITRYLFRDWAKRHLARNPKMRALEEAVTRDGWRLVCLTRLSPIMPISLINYALGVTKISAAKFLFATEVGCVPATCFYVYLGTLIGNLTRIGPDLHQHQPWEWAVKILGLLFTIGVTVYITRLATTALHARIPSTSSRPKRPHQQHTSR